MENITSSARTYTFDNVAAGDHTLLAQLTDDLLAPLSLPESEDILDFSITQNLIEEACTNISNIAPNGTARLSSSYNGGGGEASLAIDENTSGIWFADFSIASTGWEVQPYWEINLGASYNIEELNIWNRTDCCTEGLSDYYILVSEQPFISDQLSEVLSQSGVISLQQTEIAGAPSSIPIGTTARYVRIQHNSIGFMALAEVEIMGCPVIDNGNRNNQNAYLLPETATKGIDAILYPNPVENYLFVKYEVAKASEMRYFIADARGTIHQESVQQVAQGNDILLEEVSSLPPGYYVFYMQVDGFKYVELPFVKIRD
ncbi:MAG: discoidin domain-containing protein [Bacteroidota bacterium]